MELIAALGIFLTIMIGFIKVVSSETYTPKKSDNISAVTLSRYFMGRLDQESTTRGKLTETIGPAYGTRHGSSVELTSYEDMPGKTVEMERRGAKYELASGELHGPPKGAEEVGWVHGHRDRETPVYKLPAELKGDWRNSSHEQRMLFPSRKDAELISPGKPMIIANPHGDYRAWAKDDSGKLYSPGLAVKREVEAEKLFHQKARAEA